MLKLIWRMTNIALVLALCVVLLGAWTRISNAGLSCPDWPGCYGHLVLPSDQVALNKAQLNFPETPIEVGKTMLEMGHRYLAGALGLLITVLAYYAFRLRRVELYPVWLSYGLLLLVSVQAIFGMWTVTLKLYPPVVTLHLLGGVLTLTGLYLLRSKIRKLLQGKAREQTQGYKLVLVALLVLLIQIVLGGWTSSNYAGPACGHWLSCNVGEQVRGDFAQGFNVTETIGPNYEGGLLPLEARIAIQQGHRIGAVILLLTCSCLLIRLYKQTHLRVWLYVLASLLAVQVLLGGLNTLYGVPSGLAIGHHAIAICMLLVLLRIYELKVHRVGGRHE